jgi:hypothetical protein
MMTEGRQKPDEINRLTREGTCDFMSVYYGDDGGNKTKLVHMNAVYSKDGNGRMRCDLQKKRPGRKAQGGI